MTQLLPPPAQVFSTVLFDELVRLGLRHVVVCPGSRSAPLAYAALAYERAGSLTVHVRTDERAATFLALGIGKATGVPAAVVTTSGTAVANAHPAVLEAHEARVPLLMLTADRPHELRWSRANQTTRQPGMFGDSVRLELDLAAPVDGADRMRFWRTSADRAVAAARGALGGLPGPVHLNIALREPLIPQWPHDSHDSQDSDGPGGHGGSEGSVDPADPGDPGGSGHEGARYAVTADDLPEAFRGRPDGAPWTDAGGPSDPAGDPMRWAPAPGEVVPDVPRTLVLLGDAPEPVRRAAVAFAAARGHVLLAEPFGAIETATPDGRCCLPLPHGALLAETPFPYEHSHTPDRILVVGRLTLSRAVGDLLRRSGATCEVFAADPSWPDPSHLMHRVHHVSALLALCPDPGARCDDHWPSHEARRFAAVWERAASRLAEVVAAEVPATWPSGPAVARTTLASLPEGARLLLGSSSLVRDASYVRGRDDAEIVANRGLAGIDGCVSTAAGMALADPARPMYALMGDLTFLHDSAALVVGPDERVPDLTVIVVNDDGGAIFETLEYGSPEAKGRDPEAFRRLFATPTGASFADLAAAHGADHVDVRTPEHLAREVGRRPEGLRILEVRVPTLRARDNRASLVAAAERALR